ncbi:MAG: hypothetical protein HKN23_07230 [Verrucomicrobiales bacterium]|nr:hypothetical protein [Verrucomicrobiales bacterium]
MIRKTVITLSIFVVAIAIAGFEKRRHAGPVTDILVGEKSILTCSQGGVFRGDEAVPFPPGPYPRIVSLAGDPDGRFVASGGVPGESGIVAVSDPESGFLKPQKIADDLAVSVAVSDQKIFAALADGRVLEIGLDSIETRYEHTAAARSVAVSGDGKFLASGGMDRLVLVSNLRKPEAVPITILDHTDKVDCVAFSPDSALVISGARDGKIRLHSPADGKLIRTYSGLEGRVSALFHSGKRLLAGTSRGKIYELSLESNSSELIAEFGKTEPVSALAIDREGRVLAGLRDRVETVKNE